MIEGITPSGAYSLLTPAEQQVVDDYVEHVIKTQRARHERIALALSYPIPAEFTARSRGLILKPLPRAALTERIKEEAQKQDLSPDRLIDEYAAIAFSKPVDFIQIGHYGETQLKPLDEIPSEKWGAVRTINSKMTTKGIETVVQMHDKRGAMDMLAKLMGMVATEGAPLLEDYATNNGRDRQALLDAPEDLYAQIIEG